MKEPVGLSNKDVFSIAGRFFRFEYEQPKRKVITIKSVIYQHTTRCHSEVFEIEFL